MHQFLKFIFGLKLYMFRTVSPSIIRSLALYTQQPVTITCMTYTCCCVYSARLVMMDGETVRNM